MRMLLPVLVLIVATVAALPCRARAAETGWRSVGVRGGFAQSGRGNDLVQVEGDVVYRLPWDWRGPEWQILTQAEGSLGMATAYGEYGLIATLGPSAAISRLQFPLELVIGVSVGFLSRDTFGHKDYNGNSQFVSHAALNYRVNPDFGVSYRFQHLSNAGINGTHNPGVNVHLFGLDWYLAQ